MARVTIMVISIGVGLCMVSQESVLVTRDIVSVVGARTEGASA